MTTPKPVPTATPADTAEVTPNEIPADGTARSLRRVLTDLAWMDGGLCRQTDPELFYPEKGHSAEPAKAVCRGCPVRAECLTYALAADERWGIWGATTDDERDAIRAALSDGRRNGRRPRRLVRPGVDDALELVGLVELLGGGEAA